MKKCLSRKLVSFPGPEDTVSQLPGAELSLCCFRRSDRSLLWAVISAHVVSWVRRLISKEKKSCVSILQMKWVQQREAEPDNKSMVELEDRVLIT